jgi:kinesin family protein 3/17
MVDMDKRQGQIMLHNKADAGKEPPKAFTFDAVFDWESTQREVYENTAAGIVNSTLEGYNGTVFAYGQTGTGKTHTMEGYAADPAQQGIIPQAFDHIFKAIEASADTQYLVRASFLEIYNEEIRDLLSKSPKDKLELKEHKDSGVYVKRLNAFVVKSVPEIKNVLEVSLLGSWFEGHRFCVNRSQQQQPPSAAATSAQGVAAATAPAGAAVAVR